MRSEITEELEALTAPARSTGSNSGRTARCRALALLSTRFGIARAGSSTSGCLVADTKASRNPGRKVRGVVSVVMQADDEAEISSAFT
jgi:hypothetical protein